MGAEDKGGRRRAGADYLKQGPATATGAEDVVIARLGDERGCQVQKRDWADGAHAHHKRFRREQLIFGPRAGVNISRTNRVPGWGLAIKGGEALTELVVSLLSLFEYM